MAIHPARRRFRDRREANRRAASEAEQADAAGGQEEATVANNTNEANATNNTNGDLYSTQTDFPPSQKRIRRDDDYDFDSQSVVEEEYLRRRLASTPPGDHRLRDPRDRVDLSETPVPFRDDWSDPDTASIASHDSDDLAARRPNRWRGNPRAWQHITELDRAVINAMGRTRDRDLAAHLYNAFRMKQAVNPTDPAAWGPKAYWTAWPLRLRDYLGLNVFDDNSNHNAIGAALQAKAGYGPDPNDPPIFHTHEPPSESRPSGALEEILTATIQRVAREQFYLRQQMQQQAQKETCSGQSEENNGTEAAMPEPATTITETAAADTPDATDTDDAPAVILADDELAADLLQPSVRHLLAQVDKVLSILHNTRVATAAISEDSESILAARSRRQRSPSADPGTGTGRTNPKPAPPKPKEVGGRGRPAKKRERLPGETEKQFIIRIARQAHRRLPYFSDDEEDKEGKGGRKESKASNVSKVIKEIKKEEQETPRRKETVVPVPVIANQSKSKTASSPARQRRVSFAENVDSPATKPKAMKESSFDGDSDTDDTNGGHESDWQRGDEETNAHKQKRTISATKGRPTDKTMARWPLRDWTDVLGAAALSGGFSPEVLARATQRCSDLFGQSMSMDTLAGVELGRDEYPENYVQYHATHKAPLSVDRHVYTPGAAGPYPGLSELPDEIDTTALEDVTVAVQRTRVRRLDRLAKRQAFIEERLGGLARQDGQPDAAGQEGAIDGDSDDDNDPRDAQSRPQSTSAIPLPVVPGAPSTATKRRSGTQPRSTPTVWYCPRPNCPRAVDGFTRRPNMKRHLKLMHNIICGDGEKIVTPPTLP
ncbi:hypothetical protein Sste5344_009180 [Sporothrix stenoceras]